MRWPFPAARRTALLAILAAASLSAQTPAEPACYRERLAAQLTPVEEVLKTDVPILPSDSGAVLLNERLVWVDAQGLRTTVRHTAYKTLTDAAVQENSEIIVSFRKKEQKAYLITAETIQPDGSRQPVKPDAVFIQSPQRQAEYAIYDDQSELKMIFPNVKPGSVTHFIVVIEDLVAKLPCEFNQSFYWGGTWATGLLRYRIDLPGDMAKRLRIETVGKGVPAVKTVRDPEGRVNHTWTVRKLAGRRYEIEFPPPSQVGPAINSSTINSWDDIGRWYRGLLAGRNQPGEALARQVDEWTASVKTPSETITLLHQKVAEQVRYVGLEFGTADYQPHPCREVWENRYGDCKDKANLLVALLEYRGIKAHIALVQTEYLGLVDRRTPDFRVFNHAIVAIPQKSGGFLFCDPTITYSNPGMLGPGSSDRDVLVITDQGTQWVHTPAQIAGRLHYQFDLKLADSGELSGWITYTADGFYGASERDRFARLDTEDARSGMSRIARGFYRGAEIIDVARTETPSSEPYVIKAYFIVPGAAAGDGKQTLRFPSSTAMFSDLGDRADRETPFFMYQDNIRASATIALPPGLHPSTIPPPFRFEAPAGATRARWTFEKSVCTTDLQVDTTLALLKPQDFGAFYRATQSLQTWLAQPVELTADTKLADQRIPAPELDLPLMPTGDGQIDLLDRRYPESGNQEMRRLALERTIQYFPDDKTTVFRASVRLAVIDWNADRTQAAHDRLNALLVAYAGKTKPDTFAWAEILDGLMLRDLQRDPEAIARLRRVACDPALPDSRRAEACVEAADLIMKQTPADALKLLLEVAALPDGATPFTEKRIAHLLLITDQTDALRTRLAHVVQSRPDSCEELLIPILEAEVNGVMY